jgi:hypothetical protein
LKISLILGASVIAGAQTQGAELASVSHAQRGNDKYWQTVDEFADRAVNFAYAKHFVQVHEGSLTERQCQQYSRMSVEYADQLAALKQAGVSSDSEFWNDVRAHSISMIGGLGVSIPDRPTSKYSLTTGSEAEDRELRRIVSLEIDETRSQLIWITGYSASAVEPNCRTASQTLTTQATSCDRIQAHPHRQTSTTPDVNYVNSSNGNL